MLKLLLAEEQMGLFDFLKKSKNGKIQEIEEMDIKKEYTYQEINEILEREAKEFFPKTGEWYSQCFQKSDALAKMNLPCHLNNKEWIAKLFHKELNKKDIHFSMEVVRAFVEMSGVFEQERVGYLLSIIDWQIAHMKKGGENWLIPEGFNEYWIYHKSCDKCFREGIVDTLTAIGMEKDAVEMGIELNADKWRDQLMHRAYQNRFNPQNVDFSKDKQSKYPEPEQGHEENWVKLRKYQYYIRHKKMIDLLGLATPEMVIGFDEAMELFDKVSDADERRVKLMKRVDKELKQIQDQDMEK